jgi:hypothetical protein
MTPRELAGHDDPLDLEGFISLECHMAGQAPERGLT